MSTAISRHQNYFRNRVVAIGIATWGSIPGHEEYLTQQGNPDEFGNYEAHYPKPVKVRMHKVSDLLALGKNSFFSEFFFHNTGYGSQNGEMLFFW